MFNFMDHIKEIFSYFILSYPNTQLQMNKKGAGDSENTETFQQ